MQYNTTEQHQEPFAIAIARASFLRHHYNSNNYSKNSNSNKIVKRVIKVIIEIV